MTRILLADDHQVVILGVRNVLEGAGRHQIVGDATNAAELIRKTRELAPDVIITDYNMPSEDGYSDGLALVQYLRRNFPDVRILIHTMITSPVIVASLYEEGVSGVVFKSRDLGEILTALDTLGGIRCIAAGPIPWRPPCLAPRRTRPRGSVAFRPRSWRCCGISWRARRWERSRAS